MDISLKRNSKPDKGYSWLVLIACFFINVFVAGGFGTFGVFMVEFTEYFDCSKTKVAWLGSAQIATSGFSGKKLYHG